MSTVDAISLQAFPWRELAKKKMNEAQARLVKEGGSGDMKEQERLEAIQRRENWDRTRALLNKARQDTNQPVGTLTLLIAPLTLRCSSSSFCPSLRPQHPRPSYTPRSLRP